jgi:uncharacterized spore protein YtfJ
MALRELVGSFTEASTVKRVFGQPIEKDGVLVIPVANVRGGFGGGESELTGAEAAGPASKGGLAAAPQRPKGWGGGGAWSASPAGAYVLTNGEVSWVPAVNANRTVLLGCLTGIVSLLVLRSIVRSLIKRG